MRQIFADVKNEHFNLFLRKVNDWYGKFKTETGANPITDQFIFDISMIKSDDLLQYLVNAPPNLVNILHKTNVIDNAQLQKLIKEEPNLAKLSMTLKLRLMNEAIKQICSPIDTFISNAKQVYETVVQNVKTQCEKDGQMD